MRGMGAEIQGATSGNGKTYVCFLTLFVFLRAVSASGFKRDEPAFLDTKTSFYFILLRFISASFA